MAQRGTMTKDKIREPVKTCVIDNPNTMARECWQDGKLIYSYSSLLFITKSVRDPAKTAWDDLPAERVFFGAAIGPWKEGQIVGDIAAMPITTQGRKDTAPTGATS